MRISDWSSDVCSSDLLGEFAYRNGRDLHCRIRFPGSEPSPSTKPALKPSPSWGGLGGDGFPPSPTESHPHPGHPLGGEGRLDTPRVGEAFVRKCRSGGPPIH